MIRKKIKIELIETNEGQILGVPKNPRYIKDAEFERLKQSIKDFPEMLEIREVVVFPLNGRYIALGGNMRFLGCKDLGYTQIDCVILPADMPAEKLKEFAIKDNGNFGAWDFELLANEWDLELLDMANVVIPNFELPEETPEAKEDDFAVPADGIETDIVLGDLFEIGEHRLLCGDSTDSEQVAKLMNGEKADMVFTDPPFPNNSEIMHDMIKNIDGAFNNSRLFCDNLMIWFWDNLEFPPFLEQVTSKHIWHKTNGWQAGHFETMYCYHNDKTRHEQKVFSVNNVGGENNRKEQGNHPTPKPITLVVQIIDEIAKKSNSILDLFLGSGTTMVASHQLKRKCYGMELDPKYCSVILNRMKKLDKNLEIKCLNRNFDVEKELSNYVER